MRHSGAFVAVCGGLGAKAWCTGGSLCARQGKLTVSQVRPKVATGRWRMTIGEGGGGDAGGSGGGGDGKEGSVFGEFENAFKDMDEMAEEWIGTNLARWEWYERMKARQKKWLSVGKKNEEEIDRELEELKRTLVEMDELFGTAMLDDKRKVTLVGWSIVAAVFLGYVWVGYWLFEVVTDLVTKVGMGTNVWAGFM